MSSRLAMLAAFAYFTIFQFQFTSKINLLEERVEIFSISKQIVSFYHEELKNKNFLLLSTLCYYENANISSDKKASFE